MERERKYLNSKSTDLKKFEGYSVTIVILLSFSPAGTSPRLAPCTPGFITLSALRILLHARILEAGGARGEEAQRSQKARSGWSKFVRQQPKVKSVAGHTILKKHQRSELHIGRPGKASDPARPTEEPSEEEH